MAMASPAPQERKGTKAKSQLRGRTGNDVQHLRQRYTLSRGVAPAAFSSYVGTGPLADLVFMTTGVLVGSQPSASSAEAPRPPSDPSGSGPEASGVGSWNMPPTSPWDLLAPEGRPMSYAPPGSAVPAPLSVPAPEFFRMDVESGSGDRSAGAAATPPLLPTTAYLRAPEGHGWGAYQPTNHRGRAPPMRCPRHTSRTPARYRSSTIGG